MIKCAVSGVHYCIVIWRKVGMISADWDKGNTFWLAFTIFVVIVVLKMPCNLLSHWL
jgi:hypothetical protein